MRILILGASGMLGHVLLTELSRFGFDVYGTLRHQKTIPGIDPERICSGVHAENPSSIETALDRIRPDVVINAIGLIRQLPEASKALPCIDLNARLPHVLAGYCAQRGIRFIHYSTDCVFNGQKGTPYTENDPVSASDIYGLSKYLGEVSTPALTLRTSIIGPELQTKWGLLEWFLSQNGKIQGYTKAIFTGLTTVEQARVLAEYVFPNPHLSGLYHVVSEPISKYDLLTLVSRVYKKTIIIDPDDHVNEDKRLSGEAFFAAVGYRAPSWPDLIQSLREKHNNA